ncbi:hypothetical protein C0992_012438 [Termitomyces sp. T32_za158]|nr:hypothetical protein C0992_012438 [Termitomyces sp. T32_za158]
MGLEEVCKKLSNDQLRELVKETKIRPEKMNPLDFCSKSKDELNIRSRDGLKQTLLSFQEKKKVARVNQEKRLLQMARAKLGRSVRVNIDFHWLVARLNVIYERSTEYPKSLLVPSLLISFKKRNYPEYTFTRDSMIWSCRDEFMDYFEALRLEAAIQMELEPPSPGRPATKTPAFVTPTPSGRGQPLATPFRTPLSAARFSGSPAVCKREDGYVDENFLGREEPLRVQTARRVKAVFNDYVFPQWKELVARRRAQGVKVRAPGLERFEPGRKLPVRVFFCSIDLLLQGFVYTRIFSHAMQALAALKLYAEENTVVEALLQQPFWRQGRRARWYERRALLHTNYLCRDPDPEEKKKDLNVLHRAMEGIKEALNDEETHLIYRPSLVRRLMRLEKQLKIPEEDRSFCSGELRKAEEVQFSAERIKKSDKSLELDIHGRPVKGHDNGLRTYFSPKVTNATPNGKASAEFENPQLVIIFPFVVMFVSKFIAFQAENFTARKWKGKSLWRGRKGEQVNVEYVPGAFETVHQTAPLDMAHDSFYRARKELIDTRLEEIKQRGRAWEIVKHHDDLYRAKNTWCIGVRWDICTKEDLLDIVECLGGDSLAIICRLFCEDYAGRSSGVPDLIVWNITAGICKFVEVKGPGDTPSENQKLWFDSLIGAGANVEICKVFDKDKPPPKPSTRKTGKQRSSKGKGKAPIKPTMHIDSKTKEAQTTLRRFIADCTLLCNATNLPVQCICHAIPESCQSYNSAT